MYSYREVEVIKTNLEWIVNQAAVSHSSLSRADQKALIDLLFYEILLDLINEFGTAVIEPHIAEGLAVTETLIARVKNSAKAM